MLYLRSNLFWTAIKAERPSASTTKNIVAQTRENFNDNFLLNSQLATILQGIFVQTVIQLILTLYAYPCLGMLVSMYMPIILISVQCVKADTK